MQKWEYLDVFIYAEKWRDSAGESGEIEWGGNLGGVTATSYAALLNMYGEQGWELVSQLGEQGLTLVFKRPKP